MGRLQAEMRQVTRPSSSNPQSQFQNARRSIGHSTESGAEAMAVESRALKRSARESKPLGLVLLGGEEIYQCSSMFICGSKLIGNNFPAGDAVRAFSKFQWVVGAG